MSDTGDFTLVPWEQLDGETSRAFELFGVYRDLGAARSIEKAWKAVREKYGYKSPRQLERWSTKYRWVDRARAYDAYVDKLFLDERAREREKARSRSLRVVGKLKSVAWKALKAKVAEAEDLDISQISLVLERMDRIESRLLGTHAPIEITTPAGQPFRVEKTHRFTKEEIEALGAASLIDIFRDLDD